MIRWIRYIKKYIFGIVFLVRKRYNVEGQLSELEKITYRAMMGEFIIYYRGKIVGGIYDDRLLVKPIKSAIACMPAASYELPYEGAKEMLLVVEKHNLEIVEVERYMKKQTVLKIFLLIALLLTVISLTFHNDVTLIAAAILMFICVIISFARK